MNFKIGDKITHSMCGDEVYEIIDILTSYDDPEAFVLDRPTPQKWAQVTPCFCSIVTSCKPLVKHRLGVR